MMVMVPADGQDEECDGDVGHVTACSPQPLVLLRVKCDTTESNEKKNKSERSREDDVFVMVVSYSNPQCHHQNHHIINPK